MHNLPLSHWSSQLFDLRAPSSTDAPVLLLNQRWSGKTAFPSSPWAGGENPPLPQIKSQLTHCGIMYYGLQLVIDSCCHPLQHPKKFLKQEVEVAWENSRRFATPPLVSLRTDARVTREETPYLWRVTTLIFWMVKTNFSCGMIAIRGSSQWVVRHISMEFLRSFLISLETSGGVAKCGLVSQDMSRTGYCCNLPRLN